jgi:integrase
VSRPKNPLPTYKRHKTEARCWVGGRWLSLGPWDSPESRAEFARVCAEVAATSSPAVAARAALAGATVAEILLAFWDHVERHHRRPDGTPTGEVKEYRQAVRVLRRLYGHTPAREFGPVALQTVRAEMTRPKAAGGLGWCRSRTNKQVGRVRRVFKWAASQELVTADVWVALGTVAGLRKGRSEARETEPVTPAPEADYEATLPHLVPTVRAMVQLQRTAGLRPGEVRHLTPADIDRTGDLWVYRPDRHKMEYLGITKAIPLSPAARALLEPWLEGRRPGEVVFSPSRAREEMYAERRGRRKSKVTPCQVCRRKPAHALKKKWTTVFTDFGYAAWVRRACVRAGVKPWKPGQLRHSFGTEIRGRFGLEITQMLMGHKNAKTTEIYAETALEKGKAAAKQMG